MDQNQGNHIRIWIADDDGEIREILGNSLAHGPREIQLFESGQAVLEALKKSSFDILLTDLMMPGTDGIHLLNEVKRVHPECIVIIMTGYASLDTAIQAIRGGAYDYIRKPFKFDELEIVINNACEKIFLVRENKRLFHRLKETTEEVSRLRENWEGHLANILDIGWVRSIEEGNPEMEFALKQINPISPGCDFNRKEFEEKTLRSLERLVQMRKEGFINGDEFISFKRILLQGLNKLT